MLTKTRTASPLPPEETEDFLRLMRSTLRSYEAKEPGWHLEAAWKLLRAVGIIPWGEAGRKVEDWAWREVRRESERQGLWPWDGSASGDEALGRKHYSSGPGHLGDTDTVADWDLEDHRVASKRSVLEDFHSSEMAKWTSLVEPARRQQVLDWIESHLDEYARSWEAWHMQMADDVYRQFKLPTGVFGALHALIYEMALEKYGTAYPSRSAPEPANRSPLSPEQEDKLRLYIRDNIRARETQDPGWHLDFAMDATFYALGKTGREVELVAWKMVREEAQAQHLWPWDGSSSGDRFLGGEHYQDPNNPLTGPIKERWENQSRRTIAELGDWMRVNGYRGSARLKEALPNLELELEEIMQDADPSTINGSWHERRAWELVEAYELDPDDLTYLWYWLRAAAEDRFGNVYGTGGRWRSARRDVSWAITPAVEANMAAIKAYVHEHIADDKYRRSEDGWHTQLTADLIRDLGLPDDGDTFRWIWTYVGDVAQELWGTWYPRTGSRTPRNEVEQQIYDWLDSNGEAYMGEYSYDEDGGHNQAAAAAIAELGLPVGMTTRAWELSHEVARAHHWPPYDSKSSYNEYLDQVGWALPYRGAGMGMNKRAISYSVRDWIRAHFDEYASGREGWHIELALDAMKAMNIDPARAPDILEDAHRFAQYLADEAGYLDLQEYRHKWNRLHQYDYLDQEERMPVFDKNALANTWWFTGNPALLQQVYDWVDANIDEWASDRPGWHMKMAEAMVSELDPPPLWKGYTEYIHAIAYEKYGTDYPTRTPPVQVRGVRLRVSAEFVVGAVRAEIRALGDDPATYTPDRAHAVLDEMCATRPDLLICEWYTEAHLNAFYRAWSAWLRQMGRTRTRTRTPSSVSAAYLRGWRMADARVAVGMPEGVVEQQLLSREHSTALEEHLGEIVAEIEELVRNADPAHIRLGWHSSAAEHILQRFGLPKYQDFTPIWAAIDAEVYRVYGDPVPGGRYTAPRQGQRMPSDWLSEAIAEADERMEDYVRKMLGWGITESWHFQLTADILDDLGKPPNGADTPALWGYIRDEAQRRRLWPWDGSESGNAALQGDHYTEENKQSMMSRSALALDQRAEAERFIYEALPNYDKGHEGWHAELTDEVMGLLGLSNTEAAWIAIYTLVRNISRREFGRYYPDALDEASPLPGTRTAPAWGMRTFSPDVLDYVEANIEDWAERRTTPGELLWRASPKLSKIWLDVLDYMDATMDDWTSGHSTWHSGYASHLHSKFGLPESDYQLIYDLVRLEAVNRYGTLLPGRSAPVRGQRFAEEYMPDDLMFHVYNDDLTSDISRWICNDMPSGDPKYPGFPGLSHMSIEEVEAAVLDEFGDRIREQTDLEEVGQLEAFVQELCALVVEEWGEDPLENDRVAPRPERRDPPTIEPGDEVALRDQIEMMLDEWPHDWVGAGEHISIAMKAAYALGLGQKYGHSFGKITALVYDIARRRGMLRVAGGQRSLSAAQRTEVQDLIDLWIREYYDSPDFGTTLDGEHFGWHSELTDEVCNELGISLSSAAWNEVWAMVRNEAVRRGLNKPAFGINYDPASDNWDYVPTPRTVRMRTAGKRGILSGLTPAQAQDVRDWVEARFEEYHGQYEDPHVVAAADALDDLGIAATPQNMQDAWIIAVEVGAGEGPGGYERWGASTGLTPLSGNYLLDVADRYRTVAGKRYKISGTEHPLVIRDLTPEQAQEAFDYVDAEIQNWAIDHPTRVQNIAWHYVFANEVCEALGIPKSGSGDVWKMVREAAERYSLPPFDRSEGGSWAEYKGRGRSVRTLSGQQRQQIEDWIDAHLMDYADRVWHWHSQMAADMMDELGLPQAAFYEIWTWIHRITKLKGYGDFPSTPPSPSELMQNEPAYLQGDILGTHRTRRAGTRMSDERWAEVKDYIDAHIDERFHEAGGAMGWHSELATEALTVLNGGRPWYNGYNEKDLMDTWQYIGEEAERKWGAQYGANSAPVRGQRFFTSFYEYAHKVLGERTQEALDWMEAHFDEFESNFGDWHAKMGLAAMDALGLPRRPEVGGALWHLARHVAMQHGYEYTAPVSGRRSSTFESESDFAGLAYHDPVTGEPWHTPPTRDEMMYGMLRWLHEYPDTSFEKLLLVFYDPFEDAAYDFPFVLEAAETVWASYQDWLTAPMDQRTAGGKRTLSADQRAEAARLIDLWIEDYYRNPELGFEHGRGKGMEKAGWHSYLTDFVCEELGIHTSAFEWNEVWAMVRNEAVRRGYNRKDYAVDLAEWFPEGSRTRIPTDEDEDVWQRVMDFVDQNLYDYAEAIGGAMAWHAKLAMEALDFVGLSRSTARYGKLLGELWEYTRGRAKAEGLWPWDGSASAAQAFGDSPEHYANQKAYYGPIPLPRTAGGPPPGSDAYYMLEAGDNMGYPASAKLRGIAERVYDWILAHIDDYASPLRDWHAVMAEDAKKEFGLTHPNDLVIVWTAIQDYAEQNLGGSYPGAADPDMYDGYHPKATWRTRTSPPPGADPALWQRLIDYADSWIDDFGKPQGGWHQDLAFATLKEVGIDDLNLPRNMALFDALYKYIRARAIEIWGAGWPGMTAPTASTGARAAYIGEPLDWLVSYFGTYEGFESLTETDIVEAVAAMNSALGTAYSASNPVVQRLVLQAWRFRPYRSASVRSGTRMGLTSAQRQQARDWLEGNLDMFEGRLRMNDHPHVTMVEDMMKAIGLGSSTPYPPNLSEIVEELWLLAEEVSAEHGYASATVGLGGPNRSARSGSGVLNEAAMRDWIEANIYDWKSQQPAWHAVMAEVGLEELNVSPRWFDRVWRMVREEAQRRQLFPWDGSEAGNYMLQTEHYSHGPNFLGASSEASVKWHNYQEGRSAKGVEEMIAEALDWVDAHIDRYARPHMGWHTDMSFDAPYHGNPVVWKETQRYIRQRARELGLFPWDGSAAGAAVLGGVSENYGRSARTLSAQQRRDIYDWVWANWADFEGRYDDPHVAAAIRAAEELGIDISNPTDLRDAWIAAQEAGDGNPLDTYKVKAKAEGYSLARPSDISSIGEVYGYPQRSARYAPRPLTPGEINDLEVLFDEAMDAYSNRGTGWHTELAEVFMDEQGYTEAEKEDVFDDLIERIHAEALRRYGTYWPGVPYKQDEVYGRGRTTKGAGHPAPPATLPPSVRDHHSYALVGPAGSVPPARVGVRPGALSPDPASLYQQYRDHDTRMLGIQFGGGLLAPAFGGDIVQAEHGATEYVLSAVPELAPFMEAD